MAATTAVVGHKEDLRIRDAQRDRRDVLPYVAARPRDAERPEKSRAAPRAYGKRRRRGGLPTGHCPENVLFRPTRSALLSHRVPTAHPTSPRVPRLAETTLPTADTRARGELARTRAEFQDGGEHVFAQRLDGLTA
ncbi:hypothetical protein DBV15_02896 [Temnothorax longispinosus]|uniref:Uncharacterized protein n=1 Tax=Temnothorax longispinosus TaxID=300112 RepID=A0A4S2JLH3_9HYME|nr:hypothetical protein DBV15_02896 [Temnothorax longispinosus]